MAQNDTHVALIILTTQMWGGGNYWWKKTFLGQILCSCAFGANIRSYTKQTTKGPTRNPISPTPPPPPSAGVHVTPPLPSQSNFQVAQFDGRRLLCLAATAAQTRRVPNVALSSPHGAEVARRMGPSWPTLHSSPRGHADSNVDTWQLRAGTADGRKVRPAQERPSFASLTPRPFDTPLTVKEPVMPKWNNGEGPSPLNSNHICLPLRWTCLQCASLVKAIIPQKTLRYPLCMWAHLDARGGGGALCKHGPWIMQCTIMHGYAQLRMMHFDEDTRVLQTRGILAGVDIVGGGGPPPPAPPPPPPR